MTDQTPDLADALADALDEFARYLATAARLAGARIAAALNPDPADDPRRRADADATAALRDDLTHALGSDHLAGLALRAVEPALLAVEVDTAQRMQDDADRERQRAEAAARRADEQQERAQRAEADAADWRTVATQYEAALQRVRDLADRWDHTIGAGPQASALRDALTGAQAAEPPSD